MANARVIVITSGKGGVGKTTTTANIGMALAALDQRVVLLDADIGLRNLDLALGLENRVVYNIVDVVTGRATVKKALIRHKDMQNLSFLPAAHHRDRGNVTPDQMVPILDEIKQEGFDFILIDCPAGIDQGFAIATVGADEAIVVTNPEMSSVRDADVILGLLETQGLKNAKLIVNRIRPSMAEAGEMLKVDEVQEILGNNIELIGVVPDDESIITSTNVGKPAALVESSVAGQAYRNIARRLMGEDVPFLVLDANKPGGFFSKIKKLFGG